jgi:hypothetical protein
MGVPPPLDPVQRRALNGGPHSTRFHVWRTDHDNDNTTATATAPLNSSHSAGRGHVSSELAWLKSCKKIVTRKVIMSERMLAPNDVSNSDKTIVWQIRYLIRTAKEAAHRRRCCSNRSANVEIKSHG